MADDHVFVLNDFRGVSVQERTRSGGKKKQVTLEISSTPIVVNLDEKEVARATAEAFVETVRAQIKAIGFNASPATLAKRKAQAKAFAEGKAWATRQFAGGRMGAMPPNQTTKLYNNSGRLAAGIVANWSTQAKAWIVRFPANRFAPDFLRQPGAMAVLERLVDLVPALRAPFAEKAVKDAHDETWAAMHQKRAMAAAEKQRDLAFKRAREGLRLLRAVVGA